VQAAPEPGVYIVNDRACKDTPALGLLGRRNARKCSKQTTGRPDVSSRVVRACMQSAVARMRCDVRFRDIGRAFSHERVRVWSTSGNGARGTRAGRRGGGISPVLPAKKDRTALRCASRRGIVEDLWAGNANHGSNAGVLARHFVPLKDLRKGWMWRLVQRDGWCLRHDDDEDDDDDDDDDACC
jgi:hypothetical protein